MSYPVQPVGVNGSYGTLPPKQVLYQLVVVSKNQYVQASGIRTTGTAPIVMRGKKEPSRYGRVFYQRWRHFLFFRDLQRVPRVVQQGDAADALRGENQVTVRLVLGHIEGVSAQVYADGVTFDEENHSISVQAQARYVTGQECNQSLKRQGKSRRCS